MFSKRPLKFNCSRGSSHEVRYLSINATNTYEIIMHLGEGSGGGPVSARVGGQRVYDDWFVPVSFLLILVPDCIDA